MRKYLAIVDRLTNGAVQRFNRVVGINHFVDVLRIIEQGDRIRPVPESTYIYVILSQPPAVGRCEVFLSRRNNSF